MNTLTSSILQRIDRILTAGLVLNPDSTVKVDLRVDNKPGFNKYHDGYFIGMYYPKGHGGSKDISDLTLVLEVSGEKWTLLIGEFKYFAWIKDIIPKLRYDIKPDYKWSINSYRFDSYYDQNPVRQIQFFVNSNDLIWFECEE